MIPVKIINKNEAIKHGWSKETPNIGGSSADFMFFAVGRKIKDPKDSTKMIDEIMEVQKINLTSNNKEVIFEHPDYKKIKKAKKINEYADHKIDVFTQPPPPPSPNTQTESTSV